MATLINQWANEAAIVLVYWNTLRKIEDFCSISALNVLLSYCWMTLLTHSNKRNEDLHVLKAQRLVSVMWHKLCARKRCWIKEKSKKANKGHSIVPRCFSDTQACLDWGWFGGQISRQGNFVRATCRAADYPWAGIIFVYQKMLIACFYE